jgi:hypothetical protein
MRIPWRDRPWDDKVCDHPLDNASCVLLKNIGDKRDDQYELEHAGAPLGNVEQRRIPCLSERATFMSGSGYTVTKVHPYSSNKVLSEHLRPTDVVMPGHAFEAVPFRWLSRESFEEQIWYEWDAGYDPDAEARVHRILGYTPGWIMDGSNQQAVIRQFFEPVEPEESLVFVYLKHSPLQEDSTRRLLVGAAMVDGFTLPGLWNHAGTPPFESSMWETTLLHSLRSDMKEGVLLPYQQLVSLQDRGEDISRALAWAPEGRTVEFSYVTEHVSDDTAIEALRSLQQAASAMRDLGLDIPHAATAWIDAQLERLWQLRGPTPGLPAVLGYLGVEAPHRAARRLLGAISPGESPWLTLEAGFADPAALPPAVRGDFSKTLGKLWSAFTAEERAALRLLSAMEISADQAKMLLSGETRIPLTVKELLENPYYASVCTYGDPLHVAFATVDRACMPATHVSWPTVLPEVSQMEDNRDRRRVEAMMVEILEQRAQAGDTVTPQRDIIALGNELLLTRPCELSEPLLRAHCLDAASLDISEEWSPFVPAVLSDDSPALKLERLAVVGDVIRRHVRSRLSTKRFGVEFDPRAAIDEALRDASGVHDEVEELARNEKAAGVAELYRSRLSVLVGPAGTGKTTLLSALVARPDVRNQGVLLLAPTGKARVQLQQKVRHQAQTLASFLVRSGRYDGDTGEYLVTDDAGSRLDVGLVVIDEASMLTEEMLAATLDALGSVKRLVLVGDPRQLPPIGAGRPFVDLVEELHPGSFAGDHRVEDGYVELTVFRRQDGQDRDDLALAAWFGGGDLPAGSDDIWARLRAGEAAKTVEHVTWKGTSLVAALTDVLQRELPLDAEEDKERAFALTYGGSLSPDGKYLNWNRGKDGAGQRCEEWQVLSPTRSRLFGTVEINRHLKRTFRTKDLASSGRRYGWRNPKPLGPELIVRGDKVMQTRNESHRKAFPAGAGLDYVANGEIGVVIGRFGNYSKLPIDVEFSSQVGATYRYWPSSTEDPPLELAWAVTVHKSQGSEFGTTILVLPSHVRLSRELMYTALTRQTTKVVILHEGAADDLRVLARPSESETAQRLTDLFRAPAPRSVPVDGVGRWFDGNLIHVAPGDIMVRSKNEVIIARILEDLAPGRWKYESPVTGKDGTSRLPDFVIDTLAGERIYWEHLGMMNNPRYAAKWQRKKSWYAENGILPAEEGGGPEGTLIWTDDRAGVDEPGWRQLAAETLGTAEHGDQAGRRRVAKKAARKGKHPGDAGHG